jgi:hypothetical protein
MSSTTKKAAIPVKTTILGKKRQQGQEEFGASTLGTMEDDNANYTTP